MIVGVSGRVSFKDESDAEILAEDIVPVENIRELTRGHGGGPSGRDPQTQQQTQLNDPVKLRISGELLDSHGETRKLLFHLTDMMSLYPGSRDVLVYLPGQKPVRCSEKSRVTLDDELRSKLERLLGAENVKG